MWAGVSKSGSPISRWMIFRPCASRARARARTSNADSVPIRPTRDASRDFAMRETLRPAREQVKWTADFQRMTPQDEGEMGLRTSLPPGSALRAAFEEHYEPLVRFCALLVADLGVAEVLAQEAFTRAEPEIGELPSEMAASSLRGLAFDRWKRRTRRWSMTRQRRELSDPSDRTVLTDVDRFADVWNVLGALPLRQRACIVLRFHEHWTADEIAQMLGSRAGIVRRRTGRALATLRRKLPRTNAEERLPEVLDRRAPDRVDAESAWAAIERRLGGSAGPSPSRRLIEVSVLVVMAVVAIGVYAVVRS